tara:strand:+ start:261 stop:449 length:189 start_codon:yes stop_codon:yes gene_type:complete
MKNFISDDVHILKDKRAWLEVDGFSMRVALIDSELSIRVFKNGEESIVPLKEMFLDESELDV